MSTLRGAGGDQKGWSRQFDDPIATGDGGALRTLRDAGVYILALPPAPSRARALAGCHGMPDLCRREGRHCYDGPHRHVEGAEPREPGPAPAPRRKRAKRHRIVKKTVRLRALASTTHRMTAPFL